MVVAVGGVVGGGGSGWCGGWWWWAPWYNDFDIKFDQPVFARVHQRRHRSAVSRGLHHPAQYRVARVLICFFSSSFSASFSASFFGGFFLLICFFLSSSSSFLLLLFGAFGACCGEIAVQDLGRRRCGGPGGPAAAGRAEARR